MAGQPRIIMKKETTNKVLTENRRARHDYFILDTYEAGIALVGTEVKSLRAGRVSLKDSFVTIKGGEAYLQGVHISPYENGNRFNHDPDRDRKLLLHKKEILKLNMSVMKDGLTLIPLQLYLKKGRVKVLLALARGKKLYDKRSDAAKHDADRQIERVLKSYR